MPTYTFKHKKNGHTIQRFMSITEGDAFVRANPDYDQLCGAPMVADPYFLQGTRTKPDRNVTERIKEIKKAHPRSTIKDV